MLCPECGRSVETCRDGQWSVETRTCQPTAAVARWRDQNPKPAPGIVLSAVQRAVTPQDNPTLASAPDWVKARHGIT